jgi:hypothetical protein
VVKNLKTNKSPCRSWQRLYKTGQGSWRQYNTIPKSSIQPIVKYWNFSRRLESRQGHLYL